MTMKNSGEPLYILKIEAQKAFNANNIANSKRVCESMGIDTSYTIGDAIKYYINRNRKIFKKQEDEKRAVFHDALHVISGGIVSTAHSEAKVGAYEIVLLREPYNGDTNRKKLTDRSRHYTTHSAPLRRYNPECEENFKKPAPHAKDSLKQAFSLASERLEYINRFLEQQNTLDYDAIQNAYNTALETEKFFSALMGDRRLYQLSDNELPAIPLAFFGLQNTGTQRNPVFEDIDKKTRQKIIESLGNQNMVLHQIEAVKTAAELLALTQQ